MTNLGDSFLTPHLYMDICRHIWSHGTVLTCSLGFLQIVYCFKNLEHWTFMMYMLDFIRLTNFQLLNHFLTLKIIFQQPGLISGVCPNTPPICFVHKVILNELHSHVSMSRKVELTLPDTVCRRQGTRVSFLILLEERVIRMAASKFMNITLFGSWRKMI